MAKRKGKSTGRPPEGRAGVRVRDYPQLSIRIPQSIVDRFKRHAKANSEGRARFLVRLLKLYEAHADR